MNENENKKDYLSLIELARLLKVTRQHLYNLLRRDKDFPIYRFGRIYRVKPDEVFEYFRRSNTN